MKKAVQSEVYTIQIEHLLKISFDIFRKFYHKLSCSHVFVLKSEKMKNKKTLNNASHNKQFYTVLSLKGQKVK